MSKSFVIAAALVAATSVAIAAASVPPRAGTHTSAVEQSAQSRVTLEVPGVGCASCSLTVRKALKGAGGVVRLEEGDPRERIVVVYEPAAGRPQAYVQALRDAGFDKAREVSRGG